MSSLNLASLPPAGAPINPSSGAPADVQRRAPAADLSAPPDAAVEAKDANQDGRGFFDRMWGKDGFSFGALIDIINPLQHIPVVGTVYRSLTGDTIGPASRIAGGTLFGGVFGLIASSIDTAVKEETGRDIGQHVLAMRDDDGVKRDVTTPTGRPERDGVLYAGDFTPRGPDPLAAPIPAPAAMLAQAEPSPPAASASQEEAASTAPQAAVAQAGAQLVGAALPAQSAARASSPQREAANGAGGAPVPFSSNVNRGARGASLPTPQSLAADPALLRQMQTTRGQSNAIRAKSEAAAGPTPSFLDYTPKNAALRGVDADASAHAAAKSGAPAVSAAEAVPEVPADLISRMNMALEKYQTMQRVTDRPAVNVTQ